jgi:hypothetical protein
MNSYILSYDPYSGNINAVQLAQIIKDNRKISQYYTPFAGTYLLKSHLDLLALQESFVALFPPSLFVLTKVNPQDASGWLSQDVWEWWNKKEENFLAFLQGLEKGIGVDHT